MSGDLRRRVAPEKPARRCLICGAGPDAFVHRRGDDRRSNVAPRGFGVVMVAGRKATTVNGVLYLMHGFDPGERRVGKPTRREGILPMPASRRHHAPGPVGESNGARRPTGGE